MKIVLAAQETNYNREWSFWLLLQDESGISQKKARLVWEDMQEGVQPSPTFSFPQPHLTKENSSELTNFILSLETITEHFSGKKFGEKKTPEKDKNQEFREAVEQLLKEHILVRKDDILALLSHSPQISLEENK